MNNYFQSYSNYFWAWEDQGQVISIPGSYTISYKALVTEMLYELAPQGFPSFGSLLMVLTATNINGKQQIDEIMRFKHPDGKYVFNYGGEDVTSVTEFLKRLTDLPSSAKTGVARQALIRAIFKNCHNSLSIKKSNSYYAGLNSLPDYVMHPTDVGFELQRYNDIRTLELISRRFPDNEQLIRAMNETIELEEIQLESDHTTKEDADFIDQLIAYEKTFHSGVLIRHLWGGLHIPVHNKHTGEQPIGGISDISNKGTFDRLLLSEFAYDDLTLMNRLANNEALYIQREIPPENNQFERFILIDVSLKNWGTPKTVAFSVALAIALHPKNTLLCRIFVVGQQSFEIDYTSLNGLAEAQIILHPGLDAAAGIHHFFADFTPSKDKEVLLITHKDTLLRPEMLKAVHAYEKNIRFLIHTDEVGKIEIYQRNAGSKRLLQTLLPDLEEIWKTKRSKTTHERQTEKAEPLIPLLVPIGRTNHVLQTDEGEIIAHTSDKKILKRFVDAFPTDKLGWEVVCDDFPRTEHPIIYSQNNQSELLILGFNTAKRMLYLLNVDTRKLETIPFPQWRAVQPKFFPLELGFNYIWNNNRWWINEHGSIEKEQQAEKFYSIPSFEQKSVHFGGPGITFMIKTITITKDKQLRLNDHLLTVNPRKELVIQEDVGKDNVKLRSTLKRKTIAFPCGSTIELVTTNTLLFTSANKALEPFYLLTLIGETAASTMQVFTGNRHYMRESMQWIEMDLTKMDHNTRRLIFQKIGYWLEFPKSNTSNSAGFYLSSGKVEALKTVARENGITCTINPDRRLTCEEQNTMEPGNFYDQFIQPFINHICEHHGN